MTRKIGDDFDAETFEKKTDDAGREFLAYKPGKAPKERPRKATRPLRTGGVTDVTKAAKTAKGG